MSKKRYMPPKGKKRECRPAAAKPMAELAAHEKESEEPRPRVRFSWRCIWVEGHYSPFGDEYRDGKVFFHHHDHGSCWEEGFTAQDLREIADAMDRKEELR